MRRFNVGDIATVRRDIEAGKYYKMDDGHDDDVVTADMAKMAGRQIEILAISSAGTYIARTDKQRRYWTDEMFESSDFEESDVPIESFLFGDLDLKGGEA